MLSVLLKAGFVKSEELVKKLALALNQLLNWLGGKRE